MKRWLTDKADNYLERAPVLNPSVRLEDFQLELWFLLLYVYRIVPRVKRSLLSRSGHNLDVFTYLSSTWTFGSHRFYATRAAGTRSWLCSSLNGSLKKKPCGLLERALYCHTSTQVMWCHTWFHNPFKVTMWEALEYNFPTCQGLLPRRRPVLCNSTSSSFAVTTWLVLSKDCIWQFM